MSLFGRPPSPFWVLFPKPGPIRVPWFGLNDAGDPKTHVLILVPIPIRIPIQIPIPIPPPFWEGAWGAKIFAFLPPERARGRAQKDLRPFPPLEGAQKESYSFVPSPPVVTAISSLPPGRVLDR